MISISTQATQDDGSVIFEENRKSELRVGYPRASRVATLDGGSEIVHSGVSEGDRIFRVYADLTEEEAATLWAIHNAGTLVHLSCREGFFLGLIQNLKLDNGALTLTFYVKARLST